METNISNIISERGILQEAEKEICRNFRAKVQLYGNSQTFDGFIISTNYRIFLYQLDEEAKTLKNMIRDETFSLPLSLISCIDKEDPKNRNNTDSSIVYKISCKDGRNIRITTHPENNPELETIYGDFGKLAIITSFHFDFGKRMQDLELKFRGWKIYNSSEIDKYFETYQGLKDFSANFEKVKNLVCPTYPSTLVVPSSFTNSSAKLKKIGDFRSKGRVPTLTSIFIQDNELHSSLWRSSQPKIGIYESRCQADEELLKHISNKVHIYDARNYAAVLGNKIAQGGGVENSNYYNNAEVFFLNIENIHVVRELYLSLCNVNEYNSDLGNISPANWLSMIKGCLDGALKIVNSMEEGFSVLVHCSDGWDRTPLLCALAQIMLHPEHRTIRGFAALIQKEFCSFGHMFKTRLSLYIFSKNQDFSPIFIQFLDCVQQLLVQFPLSFEFNMQFLVDVAKGAWDGKWGTFMTNCEEESENKKMSQFTVSFWSYLFMHSDRYINPRYVSNLMKIMKPKTFSFVLRFWFEYYLHFQDVSRNPYESANGKTLL